MSRLAVAVNADDHMQGASDAPIVLVEYGDFECPFCGRMYPIIKELQRVLGTRLALVYRHFPLVDMHAHAATAASLSEGAAHAGLFWEMHDRLFENQDALEDADLIRYAGALSVPEALVKQAFDGGFAAKVRSDFKGGIRSGVNGTPSLFLNGVRYDGELDFGPLLAAMEQLVR